MAAFCGTGLAGLGERVVVLGHIAGSVVGDGLVEVAQVVARSWLHAGSDGSAGATLAGYAEGGVAGSYYAGACRESSVEGT